MPTQILITKNANSKKKKKKNVEERMLGIGLNLAPTVHFFLNETHRLPSNTSPLSLQQRH